MTGHLSQPTADKVRPRTPEVKELVERSVLDYSKYRAYLVIVGKPASETWRQRFARKFWTRVGPPDERGCREWLGCRYPSGYGRIRCVGRVLGAHRIAYHLANDEPITRESLRVGKGRPGQILHVCDNRACCEPTHLYRGTPADNMRDRDVRERTNRPGPRIGWEKVRALQADRRAGLTEEELCLRYRVSKGSVWRYTTWERFRPAEIVCNEAP